jgi:hypothetical protein
MLTMAIWWLAILLEALLLLRGLWIGLVRSFPAFYSYISFVLLSEALRFSAYRWYPSRYATVFWGTQFLGLVVGSAVIFEIYRAGLRPFPGTARMARYLLLLVFGTVFVKGVGSGSGGFLAWIARTSVEIERDLRMVQALAILTLVILFLFYTIPFGRNLGGIVLGYGLFVVLSILQFTLWFYRVDMGTAWSHALPVTYDLVLALWAGALWSRAPAAVTEVRHQLEEDYKVLWMATRGQLERALARLGSAARP